MYWRSLFTVHAYGTHIIILLLQSTVEQTHKREVFSKKKDLIGVARYFFDRACTLRNCLIRFRTFGAKGPGAIASQILVGIKSLQMVMDSYLLYIFRPEIIFLAKNVVSGLQGCATLCYTSVVICIYYWYDKSITVQSLNFSPDRQLCHLPHLFKFLAPLLKLFKWP